MKKIRLEEEIVVQLVKDFLLNKERGNWHEEKTKTAKLREHGVDLKFCGGKRNSEFFLIECKGKSYSQNIKSAKAINTQTNWMFALAQIIKRMDTKRVISKGKHKGEINRAYKYGLGLCDESARVALYSIPKEIAKVLNLHIFSVNEYGEVIQFTPSKFGKKYEIERFFLHPLEEYEKL